MNTLIVLELALIIAMLIIGYARIVERLRHLNKEATHARIHAEHGRDSAGRVMVYLLGRKEIDRRYIGDPPYLHTIPSSIPPWAPWSGSRVDLRTIYRGEILLSCGFCQRDMKTCANDLCPQRKAKSQ